MRGQIVLLVDDKQRDLHGSALIAKQIEAQGVRCALEPINAWRAVLSAYRPDMIVFNHALRSHIAEYTRRLHEMGVLTAVLPNESILYHQDVLAFNSRRHHDELHLDYHFCWNEPHQQALLDNGYQGRTEVPVVGVPRFDYYFEPWSKIFPPDSASHRGGRPSILVCTNFGFAELKDRPKEVVDRFFSQWTEHIPLYRDYWGAIKANDDARNRFLDFLKELLVSKRFNVTLKTHPRESRGFYEQWIAALPADLKENLAYAPPGTNIAPLILQCDLEISCETCTTALESWIAKKPTIELIFDQHPIFYHDEVGRLNVHCDTPAALPEVVDRELENPGQAQYAAGRQAHLAKWCHSPNGRAAEKLASHITSALDNHPRQKKLKLGLNDYRRGWKLKACRALGQPYTFYSGALIPSALRPAGNGKFSRNAVLYNKSIKPADVAAIKAKLDSVDHPQKPIF